MRSLLAAVLLTLGIVSAREALAQAQTVSKPLECESKLDSSLIPVLRKDFPSLHVPHLGELDPDTIESDRTEGGDGCYVVATGDFTGEGRQSVAMILAAADRPEGQLVVAIETKAGWRLDKLRTFCGDVRSCYVKAQPPGTHVRTEALDGPLQTDDEVSEMSTTAHVVLSGKLESTGVVFAYSNRGWNHVWVSD